MSYDYDLLVIGSGPAGQKAAIQAAKAPPERRARRAARARRRVGQLGDDPFEDAPRGDRLSHWVEPEGDLRPELPRQGRDHDRGSPPADAERHRPRGRRRPRPAAAEPRPDRPRERSLPRLAHRFGVGRRRAAGRCRQGGHRHRDAPGAPARGGIRRQDDPRLRRACCTSTGSRTPLSLSGQE